jgi:hypothetical protein
MKWFFSPCVGKSLAALAVIAMFLPGPVGADITALPNQNEEAFPPGEIMATADGVRIAVTDRSLGEVLQAVQNASGVRFMVTSDLMQDPVTTIIEARDWSSAIRRLLSRFNRVEILTEEQTLETVLVVSRQEGVATPSIGEAPTGAGGPPKTDLGEDAPVAVYPPPGETVPLMEKDPATASPMRPLPNEPTNEPTGEDLPPEPPPPAQGGSLSPEDLPYQPTMTPSAQ